MRRWWATCGWLAATLVACASDRPAAVRDFDSTAGLAEVKVDDDGFAFYEGKRLPLDAVVLQLRQRTRAMPREQLARFVVQLLVAEGVEKGPSAAAAQAGMNRMLDELTVMGVLQVKYL